MNYVKDTEFDTNESIKVNPGSEVIVVNKQNGLLLYYLTIEEAVKVTLDHKEMSGMGENGVPSVKWIWV